MIQITLSVEYEYGIALVFTASESLKETNQKYFYDQDW